LEYLGIEKELGKIVKTCYDLESVNKLVKECPEKLVKVSEKIIDDQIEAVVNHIMKGKYKFLLLSGPSSSGKTTTANFIIKKLQKRGRKAIRVSLDDFFIDLDKCEVQADGTVDKETINKIDLPCFNKFFREIMKNNRAYKPVFNFVSDKREKELEHDIRECNKEQAAIIMESYQISPEDLLELLKEHEAENKRILEERRKRNEKSLDSEM